MTMYPDSGPSRALPPYPNGKQSLGNANGNGPGPSPRAGPSRWDADYDGPRERDERSNGYSRSSEPSTSRSFPDPPWANRPPRQPFRGASSFAPASRPRSHTPSPPRRGDRDRSRERSFDVRDKLGLDSGWRSSNGALGPNGGSADVPPPRRGPGFGPPPGGRDREASWSREDRRWSDRRDDWDREARFRDELRSTPGPRPLSASQAQGPRFSTDRIPPPRSPPSAPRTRLPSPTKDRAFYPPSFRPTNGVRPPSRFSGSGPRRDEGDRGSLTSRDGGRPFDRSVSAAGPGPSSMSYAASQSSRPGSPTSTPVPRAPRSMRGSSSPVETRRPRDLDEPQSLPTNNVSLPDEKGMPEDQDLEEGEVLSPVQPTRVPSWTYNGDDRNRRAYTPPRERERWERDRDRDRDRRRTPPSPNWAARRPLDESWSGGGGRGRRRSISNPTRRRPEEEGTVRSPKKIIPAREEGELAPVRDMVGVPIIKEEGEASPAEEDRAERPPTPDVPPPPTEQAEARPPTPQVEKLELQEEELNSALEVPSQPSRPDTPNVPPPPETTENTEVSSPVQQLEDRPSTPVHPPVDNDGGDNLPKEGESEVEMEDKASTMVAAPHATSVSVPEEQVKVTMVEAVKISTTDVDKPESLSQSDLVEEHQEHAILPMEVDDTAPITVAEGADEEEAHMAESDLETERNEVDGQERLELSTATASDVDYTMEAPSLLKGLPGSPAAVDGVSLQPDAAEEPIVVNRREPTPPVLPAPTLSSEPAIPPAVLNGPASIKVALTADETQEVAPKSSPVAQLQDKPDSTTGSKSPMVPTSLGGASSDTRSSPPPRRVTIAERRAMILPPTNGPLSSPFGDKTPRKDPMPTAYSTDAETEAGPKTADIDERETPLVFENAAEIKQANLIAAVKATQGNLAVIDEMSILAWNVAAAPTDSSRVVAMDEPGDRRRMIQHITWRLDQEQHFVAKLVATTVGREKGRDQQKAEKLKLDYLELDEEWKDHCDYLDALMENRGPPPPDLYAVPGTLSVTTPGPIAPTTPLTEEMFNARGNRRRGAGDAVTTEAEFEAILAGLADTAAKDPTYRANKTSAVVPDMILGEERNLRYDDDNDLITDPLAFYDFAGIAEPIWTPEERALFVRRYMAYPKQFGRVADGISNKTASDCVLYYYRTKKEVDYKGMLASKRGGGKKKTIPIKKGGKGAALLADLEKKKPAITNDGASTPARGGRDREDSVIPGTSARKHKGLSTPASEGGNGRRRKTTATSTASANDEDEKMDSTATSRAGSEAPTPSISKSKLRMTLKPSAKRPRVSSVSDVMKTAVPSTPTANMPNDPATTAPLTVTADAAPAAVPTQVPTVDQPVDQTVAQTELLPPVKRAGKRRKVAIDPSADPNADLAATSSIDPSAPVTGAAASTGIGATPSDKPTRRSTTNSYWSVDEKKRVKELVATHGIDVKAIAGELAGKSERQVSNFLEGHRTELLDSAAAIGSVGAGAGNAAGVPMKMEEDSKGFPSAQGTPGSVHSDGFRSAQRTRTIYDAYPSYMGQDRYEPRLGMFPPSPPHNSENIVSNANGVAPISSPPKPVSRSGGMRISALLNDEPVVKERPTSGGSQSNLVPDGIDAASDGTVDERDQDGMIRPSPRSLPPVPSTALSPALGHAHAHAHMTSSYARYDPTQRPDLDRYRSSASVPAPAPSSYPPTSSAYPPSSTPRTDMYHDRERASTTTPVPTSATHRSTSVSGPVPPIMVPHRSSWSGTTHRPSLAPHVSAHRPASGAGPESYHPDSSRYPAQRTIHHAQQPVLDRVPQAQHQHQHQHHSHPHHYEYSAGDRAYAHAPASAREVDERGFPRTYAHTPSHAHAHQSAHQHQHPHQHSHQHQHQHHAQQHAQADSMMHGQGQNRIGPNGLMGESGTGTNGKSSAGALMSSGSTQAPGLNSGASLPIVGTGGVAQLHRDRERYGDHAMGR